MTRCDFCPDHLATHAVTVTHQDGDGRPVCATTMNRCDVCKTHTKAADEYRGADAMEKSRIRIDEMTIDERLAYGAGIDGTGVV